MRPFRIDLGERPVNVLVVLNDIQYEPPIEVRPFLDTLSITKVQRDDHLRLLDKPMAIQPGFEELPQHKLVLWVKNPFILERL